MAETSVQDICDVIETVVQDLGVVTGDLFVIPSVGCYEVYEDLKLIASIPDDRIEANRHTPKGFVDLIKEKLQDGR